MTPAQSKSLKPGARVCFNLYDTDCGTVTATNGKYITIKWDDGHESFAGRGEMKRVEVVTPIRMKSR